MPTVKARFANGVLQPLERLGLEEGQEVILSIDHRSPAGRLGRGMRAAADAWKGTHDPAKLKRDIFAARLGRHRTCASCNTVPLISCGLVS